MKKLALITLLALAACSAGESTTQALAPQQETAPESKTAPIQYSEFQHGFMTTVANYAQRYREAENELQKSALQNERHEQFKKLKGDPGKIKDWIGVLHKMGTNGDGKAYITVSLSPDLLAVSTWNNSFSDIEDKTLIPQTSRMYAKLANMKEGNAVKFSGKLLRPTNLTEEGRMTEPEFLFRFTDIEKIAESAN